MCNDQTGQLNHRVERFVEGRQGATRRGPPGFPDRAPHVLHTCEATPDVYCAYERAAIPVAVSVKPIGDET